MEGLSHMGSGSKRSGNPHDTRSSRSGDSPASFSYQGDLGGIQRRDHRGKAPDMGRLMATRAKANDSQAGSSSRAEYSGGSGFEPDAVMYKNAHDRMLRKVHGSNKRVENMRRGLGRLEIKRDKGMEKELEAYRKQLETIDSQISFLEQAKEKIQSFIDQKQPLLESYYDSYEQYQTYNALYQSENINDHIKFSGERMQSQSDKLRDLADEWCQQTGRESWRVRADLASDSNRIDKRKHLKYSTIDVNKSFASRLKKIDETYDRHDALMKGRDFDEYYKHEKKYMDYFQDKMQDSQKELEELQKSLFGWHMVDNNATYGQVEEVLNNHIGAKQTERDTVYREMLALQNKMNPEYQPLREVVDMGSIAGGSGDNARFYSDGTAHTRPYAGEAGPPLSYVEGQEDILGLAGQFSRIDFKDTTWDQWEEGGEGGYE